MFNHVENSGNTLAIDENHWGSLMQDIKDVSQSAVDQWIIQWPTHLRNMTSCPYLAPVVPNQYLRCSPSNELIACFVSVLKYGLPKMDGRTLQVTINDINANK